MATPVFAPGWPGKSSWKAVGAGGFADINIQGYDWNPHVEPQDTTHSGSGGVEEWISGLFRGDGAFHFVYDLANKFHSPVPNINPGVMGTIQLYVTVGFFFQIPCGIVGTPVKSAVAGKIEGDCQFKLNSALGSIVNPVT